MGSSVFLFSPQNSDPRALAPSHGSADAALAGKGPRLPGTAVGRSLCCLRLVPGTA